MKNDTACSLSEVKATFPESLISKVLEIQSQAALVQQKTAMRLCVQVSLSADENPVGGTSPIELRHHTSDEYIAVSCPWYLPGNEAVSGRYRFSPTQPPGVIMPPDIVLDRILNFKICNPEYLRTPFWVDKLCINQDASDEKEIAVHSMDLVYQYSGRVVTIAERQQTIGCTLGLLFVPIDTVAQLTMLRKLLDGKFAENNDNEPRLLVSVEEANPVLELIEMILQDNWWHRAWIFQEEFLASRHMILLLPCTLDRTGLFDTEEGVDLFGKTAGEIEVRALNFRTEATTFCLALSCHANKVGQDRCSHILKYARRYTSLYRSKFAMGPSSVVRAMSPAVFEDISTRGITVPSDILAITANCCRYITRLNSKVLNENDESLSLAVLTLFLVNGEILSHDTPREVILQQNIFECLRAAKLEVYPPVQAGELIFIKNCRLPTISMDNAGSMVRGVLSRLDKKIRVNISASDQDFYWKNNNTTELKILDEAEKRLLRALADHLSKIRVDGGDALPTLLRAFVDSPQASGTAQYWSQQHIQVMMAKSVCRAIAKLQPLWMARVPVPRKWTPWLGIFVTDNPFDDSAVINSFTAINRPNAISFAFTSSEPDHEFKDRGARLARKNARTTSLEVRFDPKTQQITPRKWMNGLCFFNNKDHPRALVVPWPKWMRES